MRPDLTTLGKVIGGGLPVGAYGGPRDLMTMVSPAGPVYQAGTLSGNPLAVAAAWRRSMPSKASLASTIGSRRLAPPSSRASCRSVEPGACHFARVGSMWTLFFTDGAVTDWPSASRADRARFGRFFHAMLARGIALAPSQFEANFISAAHTPEDIAQTVAAIAESCALRGQAPLRQVFRLNGAWPHAEKFQPVLGTRDRSRVEAREARGPDARPVPLFRAFHEPRPDRVRLDVTQERPEMALIANPYVAESTLIDVASELVPSVEVAGMNTCQPVDVRRNRVVFVGP